MFANVQNIFLCKTNNIYIITYLVIFKSGKHVEYTFYCGGRESFGQ